MFQLLIAEDEKIERDYLKSMIEQSNLPITKIFTASNGAEAVEICQHQDCDILLLDIEMPVKNGLEALKEIRAIERRESISFILTSYSSFHYAQEAIRLHVEDFILKPSSPEQILDCLLKACNTISVQKNKQLQMNALVNKMNHIFPVLETQTARAILLGKSEIEIQKQLKLQNIFMKSGVCFVIPQSEDSDLLFTIKQSVEEKGFSCLCVNFHEHEILFVIANYALTQDDVDKLSVFICQFVPCLVGSIQTETSKLQLSYKDAMKKEKQKESLNPSNNEETLDEFVDKLLKIYETNQVTVLRTEIERFIQRLFYHDAFDWKQDETKIVSILERIVQSFQNAYPTIQYTSPQFQHPISEVDLHHYFMDFVDVLVDVKYQQFDYITKEVLRYVKQNYRKQISLQDVADDLNVSPTYISRMLNKQVGKPFTDIINEYRINDAKRLIKEDYPLKKVAFETGFRSQSYFTQIFKKMVGISPKDYRNLY